MLGAVRMGGRVETRGIVGKLPEHQKIEFEKLADAALGVAMISRSTSPAGKLTNLDERSASSVSKRRRSSRSVDGMAFFRIIQSSFHRTERCFADHWEICCRSCLAPRM